MPLCSLADSEGTPDVATERNEKTKWWLCRKRENECESKQDDKDQSKKKKKGEGFLPYWFLYIAWTLCILASFASALYTLFYSMMWGKEKSNQWFISMIFTFSQDTLINQPIKVLFLSVAYAVFIRKSDEESEAVQGTEDPKKGE